MTTAPTEVADGVFHGRGTDVNFYLLRDDTGLTLVDGGYPGDLSAVVAAVDALGGPSRLRGVLLTHAHVDHVGACEPLHARYGVPTLTGAREAAHARREFLEQASPGDVARSLIRPAAVAWTLRIVRRGALGAVSVPSAGTVPDEPDLPGRPVPVPMTGHTSGHTAYLLPGSGALLTGDGLVTGHPLSRRTGPQLLPAMFHHGDPLVGLAAVEGLPADVILPGHGEPLTMPIADAVAVARG